MKRIYYNDKGFQIGNLLYVLLKAYSDRRKNIDSYVLRTGYYKFAEIFFPKTSELFSKANGLIIEEPGYFQISNRDFSSEDLDSFCETYLLKDVKEKSKSFDNKDITIAIRRTDFLAESRIKAYWYNSIKYIEDCLNLIKIKEKENFKNLSVRITSDDPEWCETVLSEHIKTNLNLNNITVEGQDIKNNFLQLFSCDKYFICPNSTYAYWVGYLLRLSNPEVETFVPDFNTTLIENGKQIADTRNWNIIKVEHF